MMRLGNPNSTTVLPHRIFLHQRRMMYEAGACPGRRNWPLWPRQSEHVPWTAHKGSSFYHLGHKLHSTHTFKWYRGVLWCARCGGISSSKIGILNRKCRLTADSNHLEYNLKCIERGKCPLQGKDWPLPPEAESPCAPYLDTLG